MSTFGYARVSTSDQDCTIQEAALRAAGCHVVRSEKRSGTSLDGRDELADLLAVLREGDTLMVTRIDRLSRSLFDMQKVVRQITSKGAHLKAVEQPIDTSSSAGVAFLQMLGVFAEFETSLRKERQLEGIASAKREGKYKGRKPSVPVDEVKRMAAEGLGATAIAKALGVGRASVYRAMGGEAA